MGTKPIKGVKKIMRMCTRALLGLGLALSGCQASQNAQTSQILPGYQPDLPVNQTAVTNERLGPNEFRIQLIRNPEVDVQENDTWCWAASAAALLNYDGITLNGSPWTQDDIIRAMAAHKSNQSAGEEDVLLALMPLLMGQYQTAQADFDQKPHLEGFLVENAPPNATGYYQANTPPLPDARGLIDQLAKGNPVIVAIDADRGGLGHVVVATGVRFSMASTDVAFGTTAPYFIREIYAIDPRDGKPTSYTAFGLQPGEEKNAIDRVAFAISRPLARQFVVESIQAYLHPVWVPANAAPNYGSQTSNTKTIKLF
jgi:peptidase C39-like protein